jgi:hypothetical protein
MSFMGNIGPYSVVAAGAVAGSIVGYTQSRAVVPHKAWDPVYVMGNLGATGLALGEAGYLGYRGFNNANSTMGLAMLGAAPGLLIGAGFGLLHEKAVRD